MKYYDTGTILFKNGEWIKHPEEHTYPFDYVDRGSVYQVHGEPIGNRFKWLHEDHEAVYLRAGYPYVYNKTLLALKLRMQWMLGLKQHVGFLNEVGVYENGDVAVYLFRTYANGLWITFYKDSHDSYVLISEGNCCKVTLSSVISKYHNDELNQILVDELYDYCYENILTYICDRMCDLKDPKYKEKLHELRETFKKED